MSGTGRAWRAEDAPRTRITELEGAAIDGEVSIRIAAHTETMLVLDVWMPAGTRSAPHAHRSDSTGVMISGLVRATVGGETSILEPGDGFHHPQDVEHHVEALEDSRWIEIKSPPRRPW